MSDEMGTFRTDVEVANPAQPLKRELIAAVVSIEMVEMVNEARENRRLARIAARRLEAIEAGEDKVLDETEFWAAVDKRRPAAEVR